MEHYDVVIVGAGPAGGYVAGSISKAGYKVALLEEHSEIGRPVQCAGLVTPRVFEILGFKCGIVNEVRGARVHSPSNRTLLLDAKKPKACVIDRAIFDGKIVNWAVDSGCKLLLRTKVKGVTRGKSGVKLDVTGNDITDEMECKLIVGSDGVGSTVARSLDFPKPKEILSGFGAEYVGDCGADKDFADIFVGNNIAPGFFAWMIPTGGGVRVGLCTSSGKKSTHQYFKQLLSHPEVKKKLRNARTERYTAGLIPLGPMSKTYSERTMLVGDAAAQVKPLSGGGIYLGLLSGGHCADVAIKALENEDFTERLLREYQKRVQNDVGKELKRATTLRKIFVGLKDEHLEEGFKVLDDERILNFIAAHGDIDYPSGLTKAVLKKAPRLMKFAGPVLKSLI